MPFSTLDDPSPFGHNARMMNSGGEQENLKIVLDQMRAYNARDIEGCLKYWSDDLKVILMPEEEIMFSSKQQAREFLALEFGTGTGPIKQVIKSETNGPYVYLVHEECFPDGSVNRMRFAYFIEDGMITKMWNTPFE